MERVYWVQGVFPLLSVDQSKRLSKKQYLPVSAWSLPLIFFSYLASHGWWQEL